MAFSIVRTLSSAVFQIARTKACIGFQSGSVFVGLRAGQASFYRASNLRSLWSLANYGSQWKPLVRADENGCFCKNGTVCKLHTTGDHDLADFLKDEIKLEKDIEKKTGKLPKIKGFEVTKTDGPHVVLTRKIDHETITVKLNVNDSVDDSASVMEGEQQEETPGAQLMVSKPAFVVEINKGGDKTLAIHCIFPEHGDVPQTSEQDQPEHYEDLIEIQDVALLNQSQEWTEDVYTLSGSVMDGNLYDMLLKLLEERGIDSDFLDQVVEFSTSYEHKRYIELLEHLKNFADTK